MASRAVTPVKPTRQTDAEWRAGLRTKHHARLPKGVTKRARRLGNNRVRGEAAA